MLYVFLNISRNYVNLSSKANDLKIHMMCFLWLTKPMSSFPQKSRMYISGYISWATKITTEMATFFFDFFKILFYF